MGRLKVCFLIPGFADGGAQKQCIYLLNELQQRKDIDLYLIYFHPGVHDALLHREGLNVIRIPVASNYDPRNIVVLRRMLREVQPDILMSWLHVCDVSSFFIKRAVTGMRWLMAERDSSYPLDFRFWLRKRLGRHADGIISNSRQGDEYWARAGAKGQRFIVPNIVHRLNEMRSGPGRIERTVIFVGRLEPQKNPVTLTRAFCGLALSRSDCRFLIIGEGSLRPTLEKIVREAGVGDRVSLLGFRHDVAHYMARASAVVSLSHHEGSPNALLESVAFNTPVIASDIPEHRDLLGALYPYYVHDRLDAEACAKTIESVLDAADAKSALVQPKARVNAMTANAVADSYMTIFSQMAVNRRG